LDKVNHLKSRKLVKTRIGEAGYVKKSIFGVLLCLLEAKAFHRRQKIRDIKNPGWPGFGVENNLINCLYTAC
jgi:hypothetical protein